MIKEMIPSVPDLPPKLDDAEKDEDQFRNYPWIEPPFRVDYGTSLDIGMNVFINFGSVILDTTKITIGARTMFAPGVHLYSATHPTDPGLRDGGLGPELGKDITIGEDCWIGGQVVVCPGVTIGRGSTVGAGAVVTKDVLPFSIVGGNPARLIKRVTGTMAEEYFAAGGK